MKNIGFDQIAGGTNVNADTMAELVNDGTDEGKAAFAEAVSGVQNANPAPVVASELQVDTGTKTASATAGAATLNKNSGVITSEALTTAAGGLYTLTLTDDQIAVGDVVLPSVGNGTNTQGTPAVCSVTPGAGSVVIVIKNLHASEALNGTLKIGFLVVKNSIG